MSRRRKLSFTLLVMVFAVFALNAAARKYARRPAADAYDGVYVGHPTRLYGLKPGAAKLIPIGLFGEYAAAWRKSRATYAVSINDQGYRDRDFGPKKQRRIVALGDSSTFGWDVEMDEAWPRVLERILTIEGRPAETLNLAVPGYSSHQGVLMLPEVWPLAPDLLIVAFGRNDELDTAYSPTEHGRGRTDAELMPGDRIAPAPPPTFRQRVRETDLYRAVRQLEFARQSAPRPDEPPPKADAALRRVPLPAYVDNLRTIVAAARERQVEVILLSVGCFFEEYRKALLDVAREENVRAVNAFPLLFSKVEAIKTEPQYAPCRERLEQWLGRATLDGSRSGWLWFSTDFGHPNACGHTVIAETLAALIPNDQ